MPSEGAGPTVRSRHMRARAAAYTRPHARWWIVVPSQLPGRSGAGVARASTRGPTRDGPMSAMSVGCRPLATPRSPGCPYQSLDLPTALKPYGFTVHCRVRLMCAYFHGVVSYCHPSVMCVLLDESWRLSDACNRACLKSLWDRRASPVPTVREAGLWHASICAPARRRRRPSVRRRIALCVARIRPPARQPLSPVTRPPHSDTRVRVAPRFRGGGSKVV